MNSSPRLALVLGALAFTSALLGCEKSKPQPDPSEERPAPTTPVAPVPSPPVAPPSVEEQVEAAIYQWNDAHAAKHQDDLKALFADQVQFYGTSLSRSEVLARKKQLLEQKSDFKQKLSSNIRVVEKDGHAHGSFVKEVTIEGKTKKYPSYLEFARVNGKWLIVTEGDAVTDKNLTKHTGSSVGDYDGDGAKETARLVIPNVDWEALDCEGPCNCKIAFSDPNLPEIPIENCVGGSPVNEGDLDDDGADEIGLLPWWFTSCWRGYQVWTLKEGKASHLIPSPMTHCNQWDVNAEVVEKDPERPGYLIVRETSMKDHSLIERSVKVREVPSEENTEPGRPDIK